MNPLLRLFVLTAAAGIIFLGTGALATAVSYTRLRQLLGRVAPTTRAHWLVAIAAAPWVLAAALVTACFLPSLSALAGLGADHCPAHGSHHPHLCFVHLPSAPLGTAELFLVGTAAVVLVAMMLRLVTGQLGAWRSSRALLRATMADELRAAGPLAVTVGLWKPHVVVTPELRTLLTPDQLQVVVEHEGAHARRRDSLWTTAAAVLSIAHLPRIRRAVLRDLALACEEACDEAAASTLDGDRLRVAETVVAVEKIVARAAWAPTAFGGGNVPARVESLLAPPLPESGAPSVGALVALLAAAGAIVVLAPVIHHLTETLLGFLSP